MTKFDWLALMTYTNFEVINSKEHDSYFFGPTEFDQHIRYFSLVAVYRKYNLKITFDITNDKTGRRLAMFKTIPEAIQFLGKTEDEYHIEI